MSEFDILRSAAAGMEAQRAALDVAARNVAAAEATSGHGAFERLVPRYAVAPPPPAPLGSDGYEPPSGLGDDNGDETAGDADPAFAVAADVAPNHEDGSSAPPVRYLGTRVERGVEVDAVTEMVAVLEAQRAYESNASVLVIKS